MDPFVIIAHAWKNGSLALKKKLECNRRWLQVLEEPLPLSSTKWDKMSEDIEPVLIDLQCMETLLHLGCELIQIASGEADTLLVQELLRRPKAVAILSDDTDCCIFKNSRFIPYQFFDIENELHMNDETAFSRRPEKLVVRIVSAQSTQQLLRVNKQT